MERHTGIPMGHPYSTVLISPPITRLSSLSRPLSHSRTGSVPEAVLKNRAGRIFSESCMPKLYHIWYIMSSVGKSFSKGTNDRCDRGLVAQRYCVLAPLAHMPRPICQYGSSKQQRL